MYYSMYYFGRFRELELMKPLILLGEVRVVAGDGIEPPTQGFSVLCSTD